MCTWAARLMPKICWWNWNRAALMRLDAAGCSVCGFVGADGNRPTRQFHAVGLGGFRRGQPVLDGEFSAELVKPVAALQPAHDLASQARRRPRPSLAAPACSRQHTNPACEYLGKSHFTPCSAGHDFIHHPNRTECGRSSGVEHNLAKVRVESSNLFARSNQTGQPSGWPFALAGVHPNSLERRGFDQARIEPPLSSSHASVTAV